jgi:hypothetical protein
MAFDDKTYNPLRGGIQGEVEDESAEAGTLGCLAETNRPGEQRRVVFLSAAHLLYGGRSGNAAGPITARGSRACHTNACSKCSRCCSDDIGQTLRGEFSEDIDAAIATIYAGSRYLREIEGLGVVRSTHTITVAEAHDRNQRFRVRKRGIATRVTEGTVRLLDFVAPTKSRSGNFDRTARRQILVQPRTLVAVPVTEIRQDGVIRANGAQFQTNGVTAEHFVEISGPTSNRELYKVHTPRSETEIVVSKRGSKRAAELIPEVQRPFTPVVDFPFSQNFGRHGVDAPGLAANNPNIQNYDMVEITGSTSNNGLFQIQPIVTDPIFNDFMTPYEPLVQEAGGGAQVRGVIFIRVREEHFVNDADSGAVLLSDNQEVVGLIAGRVEQQARPDLSGYGFGAPIEAIMNRLEISILTAQAAGQEQVVSATEGDPRPGGIVAADQRMEERAVLLRAQDELLATEPGRKYAELAHTHRPEVQTLINTNRRVAVAWQRNGGPLLFQLVLNAVQHPDTAIPRNLNGRPLDTCVSNILQVLDEHGSASLRSDIVKFGHIWTLLPGMSFNELKSDLRKRSGSAHG